jgi:hypothetical protein
VKALLGLDRLEDAAEMIALLETTETDVTELRAILARKNSMLIKPHDELALNQNSELLAKSRGIKVGKKEIELPIATGIKEEHEKLLFPVILLYDHYMTSDFIGDVPEVNCIN